MYSCQEAIRKCTELATRRTVSRSKMTSAHLSEVPVGTGFVGCEVRGKLPIRALDRGISSDGTALGLSPTSTNLALRTEL